MTGKNGGTDPKPNQKVSNELVQFICPTNPLTTYILHFMRGYYLKRCIRILQFLWRFMRHTASIPRWVHGLFALNKESRRKITELDAGKLHTEMYTEMYAERLKKIGVLEFRNKLGLTPLMEAAQEGDIQLAEKLVSKGANVRATDKAGRTAVMLAARNGHKDMVHVLVTLLR
jgi:hypothetical protein